MKNISLKLIQWYLKFIEQLFVLLQVLQQVYGELTVSSRPSDKEMLVSPFINVTDQDSDIDEIFSKMKETVKFPGLRDICQRDDLIQGFCRGLMYRIGPIGLQRRKD